MPSSARSMSLRKGGVQSILALTGDKPVKAAGVFELESLGLLRMIQKINHDALLQARPQSLGEVQPVFRRGGRLAVQVQRAVPDAAVL